MDTPGGEALPLHDFRNLFDDVAALETEDAAGEAALDPWIQVRKRSDRPGDDKVEGLAKGLGAGVDNHDIVQIQRLGNGLCHKGLLSHRVTERETGLGKEDGKGNAGKAAAGAEIQHPGRGELLPKSGRRLEVAGEGDGVENVVVVQGVDILAGNDIDSGVPFPVQTVQGAEALFLDLRQGKVLLFGQ